MSSAGGKSSATGISRRSSTPPANPRRTLGIRLSIKVSECAHEKLVAFSCKHRRASRAAPGAWRKPPPGWSIKSSRTCRCGELAWSRRGQHWATNERQLSELVSGSSGSVAPVRQRQVSGKLGSMGNGHLPAMTGQSRRAPKITAAPAFELSIVLRPHLAKGQMPVSWLPHLDLASVSRPTPASG
jgi:hypothetical protein